MLTLSDMKHLSVLARLSPSNEKLNEYAQMCDDILKYMDILNEIDTNEVEPTYSPVKHISQMRTDDARKTRERDEILANAPKSDGKFFIVPRIV